MTKEHGFKRFDYWYEFWDDCSGAENDMPFINTCRDLPNNIKIIKFLKVGETYEDPDWFFEITRKV